MSSPIQPLLDEVDDWTHPRYPNTVIIDIKQGIQEFNEMVSGMCEYEDNLNGIVGEVIEHIAAESFAKEGIEILADGYRVCFNHQNDGEIIYSAIRAIGNAIKDEFTLHKLYNADGYLPPYRLVDWIDDSAICLKKEQRQFINEEEIYNNPDFFPTQF